MWLDFREVEYLFRRPKILDEMRESPAYLRTLPPPESRPMTVTHRDHALTVPSHVPKQQQFASS